MDASSEMDLKRKIAMLEAENKSLKEKGGAAASVGNDRDWMSSMGSNNRAALQSRGAPGGGIG